MKPLIQRILKLGRAGWLILASMIFAAIAVALLLNHLGQISQRNSLTFEADKVRVALPRITTELKNIEPALSQTETKLAQAKTTYDKLKANFEQSGKIASGEQLLKLADNHSLKVVIIKSSKPDEEKKDNVTFLTTKTTMELKGKPDDILAFSHVLLTNQAFNNTTVTGVTLDKMESTEAVIKIDISGYSYQGG